MRKMPRWLLWFARVVVIALFLGIAFSASYRLVKFVWQETSEDFP